MMMCKHTRIAVWVVAAAALTLPVVAQNEKGNALPIPKFYDTQLAESKPGDLIHAEACSDYRLPATLAFQFNDIATTTVRFLYCSASASGKAVPATGVIIVPHGKPPASGWPVVVWAHGTSGVGRAFAPSLMKDLYYGWAGPQSWVMNGFAVVAPDYAGLGTNVPHQYVALDAQAHDVIHAVSAARKTMKELGDRWVAVGHSQGGCTVLRVAEMQHKLKDPMYLGAIAVAPAGDYEPVVEHLQGSPGRALIGYLAHGMRTVYPDFKHEGFLTPEASAMMPNIETAGLLATCVEFSEKVPAGKVLKPDWKSNEHFQKYRKLNLLGELTAFRQVLLLHGEDDEVIPIATTDELYKRMKKQKSIVEYKKYPGLAHDPLLFGSFRDQVRWVQNRFESK
jgi:alpha-beta hydrolase superfamily lysophospholipase